MRLLVAQYAGRPEHTPQEVEVFAGIDGLGNAVLTTEDGETWRFDAQELRIVLDEPRAHVKRAA